MNVNCYDNTAHLERRAAAADRAEARRDALIAQHMRRYRAIDEAVKRLRSINYLKGDRTLDEIVNALEAANKVREGDSV